MSAEISIIIPVYNGEKTIRRCLESVLAQTIQNIEIIVIDDGSVDKTAEIVSSFSDDRIILIRQENCGQGIARNQGLACAHGIYVGFVDADDTIEPDMYKKMYDKAKAFGAQVVQCAMNDITKDGHTVRPVMESTFVQVRNKGEYAFEYFYHLKHTNEVCNKLFLKSFLLQNKLQFGDTSIFFSEDLKFNLDLLSCMERIYFLKEPLYHYYISESGHCLSDGIGRLYKICSLFETATDGIKDIDIKKAVECTAAITILSYCAAEAEYHPNEVTNIITGKLLRRFIHTSMTYKSSLKHSALMFSLLVLPDFCKLMLVKKFFKYK